MKNLTDLSTAVLALAALLALSSIGCGKAETDSIGKPDARIAPVESEPAPEPAPTYSVLKDWGYIDGFMPLKFDQTQFGVERRRLYKVHASGFVSEVAALYENFPGEANRLSCIDFITIDGTEDEGTITIARGSRAWAIDPDADNADPQCPKRNGVYPYRVTEAGLEITVDDEVLAFE